MRFDAADHAGNSIQMAFNALREPIQISADCGRNLKMIETGVMLTEIHAARCEEGWSTAKIEGFFITSDRCNFCPPTCDVACKLFLRPEADPIRNFDGFAKAADLPGEMLRYLRGEVALATRVDWLVYARRETVERKGFRLIARQLSSNGSSDRETAGR